MQTVRRWAQRALLLTTWASLVACSNAKTQVDFLKSLVGDDLFPGVVLKINGATSATSNNPTPILEVSGFSDSTKVELFTSATCDVTQKVGEISTTASDTSVNMSPSALSSDGVYEFYAIVTSSLGLTSECSKNKVTYTYDTIAPTAPSGVSLVTVVHSDSTPDLQVTGLEMNSTVAIFTDAACSASLASALATSTSMNLTSSAIMEGTYQYYANAVDRAGNTSTCSSAFAQYVYDITPPAVPTNVSLASGVNSPDNNITPSVDVDGLVAGDTVKIYLDSLCISEAASMVTASSPQTLTVTPALSVSGNYFIYAKALDAYGNASACSTAFATYTLDITAPSAPTGLSLTTPASSPGNVNAPIITVSGVSSGDSIGLYSDATCSSIVGGGIAGGVNIAIGAITLSSDGSYDYYANATDSVGNVSACSTAKVTYVYDSTPPTKPNSITLSNPASSPSNVTQPTLLVGPMTSGDTAKLYSDASCSSLVGTAVASGSSVGVTLSTALSTSGTYTYYAQAFDVAGNSSSCSTANLSYVFDNIAPSAPSSMALTSPISSPGNDTTPTITVSGLTNGDVIGLYSDASCTTQKAQTTAAGGNAVLTSSALPEGSYTFYSKATDPAGNSSACSSISVAYDLDLTAPPAPNSLSLITPGSSPGNIASPMMQVSTVSNDDVVKIYSDASCTTEKGSETASGSSVIVTSSALSSAGNYNYYSTATDLAGNMSACSSVSLAYTYDNISPTVTNVTSSNANKKYGPGATISIQITLSEVVNVTGNPTLMLNTTPTTQYATYTSGSGTDTLTFTYTVVSGDSQADLNYSSTSALALSGGLIKDTALNNASLLLPATNASGALGINKDIIIMPNPPKVTLAGSPSIRINENDPAQTLQVDLEYDAHYSMTVHVADYSTMISGSEYILSTNNVVIPAGSIAQTFTLSVTNDAISNGFRRIRLAIDHINGDFPGLLAKISQKEIYIRDDESAGPAAASLAQGFGGNHTCVLKSGGTPSCWGSGAMAQLGDGLTNTRFSPQTPSAMSGGYYSLTTGTNHTCVLTSANNAKCWGNNTNGQLGDGSNTQRPTPYQISPDTYSKIAAGQNYTCAIGFADNSLWCWGLNSSYQLGDGTTGQKLSAVEIDIGVDYAMVAPGALSTCGITTTGVLKCWGLNNVGQLGDNSTTNRPTPVIVDSGVSYTKVAVGQNHACGITQTGALKCWGANTYGQLGDGSGTQKLVPTIAIASGVADLAVGSVHTCALLSNGDMKCWGNNDVGQVGDGTILSRNAPVAVAAGVISIMTGSSHTCALASNGETKCWGSNYYSQLGSYDAFAKVASSVDTNFTTVAAGKYHSCGLTTSGAVRCWGENTNGEVGDGTLSARTSPVQVIDSGVVQIAVGEYFSCAVFASGKLQCWGSNTDGRLGDGVGSGRRLRPYDIIASGVLEVDMGNNNACARLDNGSVQCWGFNGPGGKVGNNSSLQQNTPVEVLNSSFGAIAISAGPTHACALNSSNILYCWGNNTSGQFGIGSTTGSMIPVSTGLNYSQISVASGYTCGIQGGALYCWGSNASKQLGDGTTTDSSTPVLIDSGVGYSQVSTGLIHTCGVTTSGGVKCWGSNSNYQIGALPGTTPGFLVASGAAQVSASEYNTCYKLSTNDVKCLGANTTGAIGNGDLSLLRLPIHVFGL
ncbi:Ig-like domain-containing protein [Bdellovibrio sp. HCB337]|uniref:Ig-like domain-containing protein n=1 Tax=Bdellovibrio sp. HCB337 TaxID=3394358 RepID=UPI0039A697B2